MHIEMFPEELNALQIEIRNHPDLMTILAGQADKDVYVQISEIAAYCGILLDGEYSRQDLITLCGKMEQQLRSKRVAIILPLTSP